MSHSPIGAAHGPAATWQGCTPCATSMAWHAGPCSPQPRWDGEELTAGCPFPQDTRHSSGAQRSATRGMGSGCILQTFGFRLCAPGGWVHSWEKGPEPGLAHTMPCSSAAEQTQVTFRRCPDVLALGCLCHHCTAHVAPGKGHLSCTSFPFSRLCSCQMSSSS